ncbi:hypothetical protein ACE40V_23805, partial [Salmonella enterica]|uniref:hypothetical protein n=1 Tax=Salmonella enterica TaxID=28901 RepID=UPI003D269A94
NAKLLLGGVVDYSKNDYWSYVVDLNAKLDPTNRFVEKFTIDKERPELPIANYNGNIKNYAGYIQYDFELIHKLRFSLGSRYDIMNLDYINNVN